MTGRLVHPGPRAPDRRQAIRCDLRPVEGELRAGGVLMAEVAALFARNGCKGGVLQLDGVTCEPFRYVLPALARDAEHAAYYSETHAPDGAVRIGPCTASVGWRDGAAFLHGHGRWSGAFGEAMGHVLPFESRLATSATVHGLGAPDAWFEALPDAETNFTLFAPAGGGEGRSLIARLRAGEDLCGGILALCAANGIEAARVHGLGSICVPRFDDGRVVPCVATEVRIDTGRVGGGEVEIDASLVDVDGAIHSGRLSAGANPVGVTFELLIEVTAGWVRRPGSFPGSCRSAAPTR